MIQLFNQNDLNPKEVKGIIISSVVPNIMHSLENMMKKSFNIDPIVVGPGVKTGIKIKNDKKDKRYNSQIVYPIISNGDSIGTVILLSKEASTKMTDVEAKVAQSAASFLGSQMEI